MKLEVTVPEIADISKEIQERLRQLFEKIHLDIKDAVGKYLMTMMHVELTHYLGREPACYRILAYISFCIGDQPL